MAVPLDKKRNIGIIAHIDAGKTTTTERILYYSGLEHRLGNVDQGNTVTDWMVEERERGITICAAAVTCPWLDCEINIIDTPGHVDFTAEVERSLRVLDGAVVILDSVAGVQAQSETVWRQADKYHVPRLVLVNKMDKVGADYDKVVDMVRARLGARPVPVQIPVGSGAEFSGIVDLVRMQARTYDKDSLGAVYTDGPIPDPVRDMAEIHREELVHVLADLDDHVAEKYLDEEPLTEEDLVGAIRKATIAGKIVPVLCGSSLHNIGVQRLLDHVCDFLPSPLDLPTVRGLHPKTGEIVERKVSEKGGTFALLFKIAGDAHGDLFYLRMYAGRLKVRDQLLNVRTGERERINHLYRMYANDRQAVQEAAAGDIIAVTGLRGSATGDTLADPKHPVSLEALTFPETVISMAIEPRSTADRGKLSQALERLELEDPTFHRRLDPETGQTIISGMGELHLEVLKHRLLSDFNVEANVGRPRVYYKETLVGPADCSGHYIQPAGGKPQQAHISLHLAPVVGSSDVEVVFDVDEVSVPRQFRDAIRDGIESAASAGVLAGYPVVGIRVTVTGGTSHPTESTEGAFAAATSRAFHSGAEAAGMALLEPWMRFEVMVPDVHLGDVLSDLNSRRAQIDEQSMRGGIYVLGGKVPLSGMFGYATALRSLSQGRAAYSMEPLEYLPVPADVAKAMLL